MWDSSGMASTSCSGNCARPVMCNISEHWDEQGRMRGGIYYIREISNSPHPDFPDTAEPDRAAPCPVKPEALPNTDKVLSGTTTTKPTYTNGGGRGEYDQEGVQFCHGVPNKLRVPAAHQVAELSRQLAQMLSANGRVSSLRERSATHHWIICMPWSAACGGASSFPDTPIGLRRHARPVWQARE